MHSARLRVMFAGGGTGGHLYPAIAVARALERRAPDAGISFVGTAAGIEGRVVPREGFPLDVIRSAGLKGKSMIALARGLLLLPASAIDAWRVISRRDPDLVVGAGGYSSGPIVLLAALRGIPTLLLEQNAVPGLTNRTLARFVDAAAVTYDVTLPYFRGKGFVSGNPVRPEFLEANDQPEPARDATEVLIVGGSQGAHVINMAMVEAAPRLASRPLGLAIAHQTGDRDLALVREAYQRTGLAARVDPFLFRMGEEMRRASVIISRAGATTLAELAVAGRPAILIPFGAATDDHQRKNAAVLARAGAAEVIDERDLTGTVLADRILALVADDARRARMAEAMRRFARPDAADVVADRALQLAAAT
ncbi:MAG: undecaprenyldiphospho-muramoylpentapeptide beta-N-acetylglucosaminyltransferase [Acidobacteria bacterium]|nr:undecaprenyldiphospho-muramoylpentapeptide beta-N-acetylglucosaminyltransferase [Acidobacteriota bacterium]